MRLCTDTYNVVKEIITIAKNAKNQVVVEKLIELQEIFFELREENDIQLDKIKSLENQLSEIKKNIVNEKLFRFYPKGFFINSADKPILPYCSRCWMVDKKLVPLSQYGNWFNYSCPDCKTEVCVMDENGKSIEDMNKNGEND